MTMKLLLDICGVILNLIGALWGAWGSIETKYKEIVATAKTICGGNPTFKNSLLLQKYSLIVGFVFFLFGALIQLISLIIFSLTADFAINLIHILMAVIILIILVLISKWYVKKRCSDKNID